MNDSPRYTRLSGLEPLVITPQLLFVNVGERTNVTGSAQFKKLIKEDRYEEAVEVARQQVANGAQILDVNMDEGLIDSEAAMAKYLNLIAAEPDKFFMPVKSDQKYNWIESWMAALDPDEMRETLTDLFSGLVKEFPRNAGVLSQSERRLQAP